MPCAEWDRRQKANRIARCEAGKRQNIRKYQQKVNNATDPEDKEYYGAALRKWKNKVCK